MIEETGNKREHAALINQNLLDLICGLVMGEDWETTEVAVLISVIIITVKWVEALVRKK